MRSLFVFIVLVLALVLGLWKVLAVPTASASTAALRDRAAAPAQPGRPAVVRAAPETRTMRASAAEDERRELPRGDGVKGALRYPVDVAEHERVPLPPFLVRLMDGERELARTFTSSAIEAGAEGSAGGAFTFDESPRAPQSLVVEPPRGWIVLPARRFAPHGPRSVWRVTLEVMTVATARERFRFEVPDMPWAVCHGQVVDPLGAGIEDAVITLSPIDCPEVRRTDEGSSVGRAVPRWSYPGRVAPPTREDWNSVRVHQGDLARRERVEATRRGHSFLADSLVPGTWRLEVEAPGFRVDVRELDLREDATVRIVLEPLHPAGALVATLTSATGRYEQPVEAVLTRLHPVGELRRVVSWSGDADGRIGSARFDGLPLGDYVVRIVGVDHTTWTPEYVRVQPPAETLFHVEDSDVGRFAFRILDADTGRPVENCDVELSLADRRVKKFNQPCGAPVLERYPMDGPLEWIVRAPGFLEARGGRDAFQSNPPAESRQLLAEVLLARDPAARDGDR